MYNSKFSVKSPSISFTYISPINKEEYKFNRLTYRNMKDVNSMVNFESLNTLYNYLVDMVATNGNLEVDTILRMPKMVFDNIVLEIITQSTGSIKPKILPCGQCEHETEFNIDLNDIKIDNLENINYTRLVKMSDDMYVKLKMLSVGEYITLTKLLNQKFGFYSLNTETIESEDNFSAINKDGETVNIDIYAFTLANYLDELCLSVDDNNIFKLGATGTGDEIGFAELEEFVNSLDLDSELFQVLREMIYLEPVISLLIEVECENCHQVHKVKLSGLNNFF